MIITAQPRERAKTRAERAVGKREEKESEKVEKRASYAIKKIKNDQFGKKLLPKKRSPNQWEAEMEENVKC